MSDIKQLMVDYQVEKAEMTIYEAEVLVEKELWSGAVNRAYYSCFYIVSAALLSIDLSAKTHKGTKGLFNKHFVDNDLVSKDQSRFYSRLFNLRQQNDYDLFIRIEPEEAKKIIENGKTFIVEIKVFFPLQN